MRLKRIIGFNCVIYPLLLTLVFVPLVIVAGGVQLYKMFREEILWAHK